MQGLVIEPMTTALANFFVVLVVGQLVVDRYPAFVPFHVEFAAAASQGSGAVRVTRAWPSALIPRRPIQNSCNFGQAGGKRRAMNKAGSVVLARLYVKLKFVMSQRILK